MNRNITPKLQEFLRKHNIEYQYYEHAATATVAESKQIARTIPGCHSKNLFLVDKYWQHYLVCLEAHERLPIHQFWKTIGAKKLTFWSSDSMKELLGLTPGHVSLFGLINDTNKKVRLYITRTVWESELVWRHPNRNDATLVINHTTLKQYIELLWYEKQIVTLKQERVLIN